MNQDLSSPTILTAQQFNTTISVRSNQSDIELSELFEMFETICFGLGYQQESYKQELLNQFTKSNN